VNAGDVNGFFERNNEVINSKPVFDLLHSKGTMCCW
jgi:hypothetical protein